MYQIYTASDIGQLIRARRKQLGYTQGELAEHAGVGITYITHLENGKETAELGKALRLLSLLGINLIAEERA